jgi:hypothetical protein
MSLSIHKVAGVICGMLLSVMAACGAMSTDESDVDVSSETLAVSRQQCEHECEMLRMHGWSSCQGYPDRASCEQYVNQSYGSCISGCPAGGCDTGLLQWCQSWCQANVPHSGAYGICLSNCRSDYCD